eukprot:scaffold669171_cov75-Attheya_sp.AAC.2
MQEGGPPGPPLQLLQSVLAAGADLDRYHICWFPLSIKTLTFTGHSLGAALAAIAALDANTLTWDVAVGATGSPMCSSRLERAEDKSLEALKFVYGLSGSSTALLHRIVNTNDLVTTDVFPLFTSGIIPVSMKHFITHYPLDARAYTYNTTALRNSGGLLEATNKLIKEGKEHSTDEYLYSINSDIDELGTKGAWWLDAPFMQKNGKLTPNGAFLVQHMTNELELLYPFDASDLNWYSGVLASIIDIGDAGLSTMLGDKGMSAAAIVGLG